MFDFSFKKWLTLTCVKVIYSVVCLFVFIALVSVIIWMVVDQRYWQACLTLIFGSLAAIVVIFLVRIILEFSLATVRNMQNTTVLVHQAWSRSGGQNNSPAQPEKTRTPFPRSQRPASFQPGVSNSSPYSTPYDRQTTDGMRPDGFYYHNGVPYRQVMVNTEKGPRQQWQPVITQ